MQVLIDAYITSELTTGDLHSWLARAPVQLGFQAITPPIVILHENILIGQILLAESRINAHFVLPSNRAFIDIFTCGYLSQAHVLTLISTLPLNDIKTTFIERGIEYAL